MNGLGFGALLKFYRQVVNEEFISSLVSGSAVVIRDGVYKHAVVMWLMIFQRLSADGTLAQAIEELRSGVSAEYLRKVSLSSKARSGKISPATGGYARGRERLPLDMVDAVADEINAGIISTQKDDKFKGHKLFVLDGSSVRLEHSEKNLANYPQCSTEKTQAHYPLARIVVATDAITRVTLRPASGALHGSNAKGELELGTQVLPLIPEGSVVMADRFYGSFRFVYEVFQSNKQVLMRLSEKRAHRFLSQQAKADVGDIKVNWTASKLEAKKYIDLPNDAGVPGRCIWCTMRQPGFRPNKLIIFTTLDLPIEDIIEMYGLRWNVEDTLRDIKCTVKMDFIHAKSPEMVHKELVLGVVAYNLVRHFMAAFGKAHKISLEQLSFTSFLRRIRTVTPMLLLEKQATEITKRLEHAFLDPRGLILPKRSKPQQAEPRKRWPKGDKRVFMRGSRAEERKILATPLFRTTYVSD